MASSLSKITSAVLEITEKYLMQMILIFFLQKIEDQHRYDSCYEMRS